MGPVFRIWEELDKAHESHTSTMEIEDVFMLLEDYSYDCPSELGVPLRAENTFPRQDSQEYKESEKHTLRDNEAKLQDDTVLFRNDFYANLYRKPKDIKRAREISREIARPVTKKPRLTVD